MTPWVAWGDILGISRRSLLHVVRTPRLLVFAVVQPVMFVLLFRYVFGGAIQVPDGHYVDYLMPGIFLQTALFSGTTTALGVAADLQGGMLDRFRSLPMARSAVLAGRTIADLVRSLLVLAVMVAVGLLAGFRFQGPAAADIGGLALVLLFGYAFSWIFATIGLALRTPEAAGAAGFTALFPFIFASSAFVSVTSMPGWLQAFANVQPITAMANSVRALLDGGPAGHWLWQSLAWAIGITVFFSILAVRQYRKV
jgi:ABC-2 type transport system permease protein/oleandomycin transport system permease protein